MGETEIFDMVGIIPDYPGGPYVITLVLVTGRQREV